MTSTIALQSRGVYTYQESGVVASPLTLEVDLNYPHWFVGVDFYTDVELTNKVTPSAGTVVVTVVTPSTDNPQSITNGTIDATGTETIADFSGNALQIILTPAGITGAAFMRARATGNMA